MCLFCKIIKREIPSNIVFENSKVLAFLDIGPVNKGHTLVIPKKHSINIFDIEEEDLLEVQKAIRILAPKVMMAVNADGVNIQSSNNEEAGQVIMHTHFHIIPRFKDDNLKLWPQSTYKEGEAEEIRNNILNQFKSL